MTGEEEGVEIVRRGPSEGGLSILTKENETVPSMEEDAGHEIGQEATLVEEEERSSPSKSMLGSIYKTLRRKKSQRTSIILPPQLSAQLNLQLVDERRQEANQKADYARRLLEAAFRSEDSGWDKQDPAEFKGMKRIDMMETAFKYAVEARRLTGTDRSEDDVLDDHRAQGEAAALEAHHFMLACKSKALLPNLDMAEEDDGSINGGLYTPQDIQDAADKHRTKAYFHMECILSTFAKKIKAPDHIILNRSPQRNGEDLTLSTLGFDNTFVELSPTSKEKYSITSLNELMDGTIMTKPVVQTDDLQETVSQQVSPLSGTVESQLKPEIEQVISPKPQVKQQETAPADQCKPRARITPGSLLSLSRRIKRSKKKRADKMLQDAARGDDASSDVSAISELESIRALEHDINAKLKNAAENDDGDFSLVGDEMKMEAPKFVKAPSLDLSIMSLENWDNLADGSSLEDIVKKAEAEKEQKIRKEQDISPVPAPVEQETMERPTWSSRLWRSRSENFARVKPPLPPAASLERDTTALEHQKALLSGKKPDVIPPPFVIVSCEDRVRSSLDDIAPKYHIQSMNILGLDAAPANDDALSKSIKGKKWKGMMSWRKPDPSKVLSTGKLCRKVKDVDSENGVYHEGAKGITNTTDTEMCSWGKEEFGNNYRTLAQDVDSAIERAEKQDRSKDPLDSGIDMLLNNANPDIVRKVLSADAGNKEDGENGNPVDFANVEFENEDGVRTQTALMGRDAILENIYGGRTPSSRAAKPLERSATLTNGAADAYIQPSHSFLEHVDNEKAKLEKPKRSRSFFHRRKGKDSTPHFTQLV